MKSIPPVPSVTCSTSNVLPVPSYENLISPPEADPHKKVSPSGITGLTSVHVQVFAPPSKTTLSSEVLLKNSTSMLLVVLAVPKVTLQLAWSVPVNVSASVEIACV